MGFEPRQHRFVLVLLMSLVAGALYPATHQQVFAQDQAARAGDAAARAQQRANDAVERANSAQERAAASTERAISAQDRANSAAENASSALERAEGASTRTQGRSDRAGQANGGGPTGAPGLIGTPGKRVDMTKANAELVLAHPAALELVEGFAAVRGELLAIDATTEALAAASALGYRFGSRETVEGLDFDVVTLLVPADRTVKQALAELGSLSYPVTFAANHLFLQSGTADVRRGSDSVASSVEIEGPAIGIIDGAVAVNVSELRLMQRAFTAGGLVADPHATALASLVAGTGRVASAAPGAPLLVADVYGNDPRGGNALAVARSLGWMSQRKLPVIVLGLVGPPNPILERAIKGALAAGADIVAPVGNAGPAAAPLYPAAYPGVIGATAVDRKNRVIVEAARGPHVDFAAPGADIVAAAPGGLLTRVRGTSFAAPLVAGRLWRLRQSADLLAALTSEAIDLGRLGRDDAYGAGLVCGACR